jgi:hypothetical protein
MATFVAVMVFGGALAATVWAIVATLRPALARIVDLLRHGPAETVAIPALPAVRSTLRDVRVRPVRRAMPLRAAA